MFRIFFGYKRKHIPCCLRINAVRNKDVPKNRDRAKLGAKQQQKKTTEANEGKRNENGYKNHGWWEKNVGKRWTTALHTQRDSTGKSWFWIVECFVRSVVYLCEHFKVKAMRNEQRMFVRIFVGNIFRFLHFSKTRFSFVFPVFLF